MSWWSRFANILRADRVTREIEEEQRFHLDARADDLVAQGMTREEAAARAATKFGPRLLLREASRDVKLLNWLESLWRDMRLGVRLLRKDAIISSAAILSLGLAIGAVTSAFALIDALILRELPVRDPASLVLLDRVQKEDHAVYSYYYGYPLFDRLRQTTASHAELFGVSHQSLRQAILADGGGVEEKVGTQFVSGNAFQVLGIRPALGRLLTPEDDQTIGAHQTAVISHAFWMRRLGGNPQVAGQWLEIDQRPYQIVGVAEAGFSGVHPGLLTDVWLPLRMYQPPDAFTSTIWNWMQVWGRVKPGVTRDAAQAAVQAIYTNYELERRGALPQRAAASGSARASTAVGTSTAGSSSAANTNDGTDASATADSRRQLAARLAITLRDASAGLSEVRQQFERPLIVLAMIAGCVLLIACSNVANLLLARGAARGREMALRASIGAGRARLAQQVLAESSVLTAAATALGVLCATAATPLIVGLIGTSDTPIYVDTILDWRVLTFVAALGCVTTILFGLVPAMRAAGANPGDANGSVFAGTPAGAFGSALTRAFRTAFSRTFGGALSAALGGTLGGTLGGSRTHTSNSGIARPLIALQIGFSVMVLFVAALLLRSFDRLLHVDLGFTPDRVTLLSIESRERLDAERVRAVRRQLLDRVRALSGVEHASASGWALFKGSSWGQDVNIPGLGYSPTSRLTVSPDFFTTMGARIVEGREFAAHEDDTTRPIPVVVNTAFARKYFPGERAVGRRMSTHLRGSLSHQEAPVEIVGVAEDMRDGSMRDPIGPFMFSPVGENLGTLQVRSTLDPRALADRVRDELPRVHPALRLVDVTRQQTLVDNSLLRERLLAVLSGFFAALGLALAAVGLYGVSSYAVVRRTREIGIRLTLGAHPAAVVRTVLGGLALAVTAGILAGLAGGVYLASFVRTLLFETELLGPWALAAPALLLLAVALAAAWTPARRAIRVDPAVALRLD